MADLNPSTDDVVDITSLVEVWNECHTRFDPKASSKDETCTAMEVNYGVEIVFSN